MAEHPKSHIEQIEAAVFQRLIRHLQLRSDVTNAELMATAGFCRNCLVEWLVEASLETSAPLTESEMREYVYGEPYADYKQRQPEVPAELQRRIDQSIQTNIEVGATGAPEKMTELDKELADSFPASDPPATSAPHSDSKS